MTTILLSLTAYGLLMFAAGLRVGAAVRARQRDRRGGYIDLTIRGDASAVEVRQRKRIVL